MPQQTEDDIFIRCGRVRSDVIETTAAQALRESLSFARATNWDSVRTPHLFMGLLSVPDSGVAKWATGLGADMGRMLDKFRDLFHQDAEQVPPMLLNREFLSDNVIRVLRDSYARARSNGRTTITQMDILITIFSSRHSIVSECFARIGVPTTHLTELALRAEIGS